MMVPLPSMCYHECGYPAMFNFGDSTSDTSAIHYVFSNNELAESPPYGQTYFGHRVGRYSDGRLSVDFFGTSTVGYFLLILVLVSLQMLKFWSEKCCLNNSKSPGIALFESIFAVRGVELRTRSQLCCGGRNCSRDNFHCSRFTHRSDQPVQDFQAAGSRQHQETR